MATAMLNLIIITDAKNHKISIDWNFDTFEGFVAKLETNLGLKLVHFILLCHCLYSSLIIFQEPYRILLKDKEIHEFFDIEDISNIRNNSVIKIIKKLETKLICANSGEPKQCFLCEKSF